MTKKRQSLSVYISVYSYCSVQATSVFILIYPCIVGTTSVYQYTPIVL